MNINDIERKKNLAGEMGKAVCNLANIAEDWNDAQAEPGERGPGNGAIGLVVFDDGSGMIAEFQQSLDDNPLGNGVVVSHFSTPEQAVDWFVENVSGRSLYTEERKLFSFDSEIKWILGQPNFACAGIAGALRKSGMQIERKSEAEQAAVIYWMLEMYMMHKDKWRRAATEFLEQVSK